MGQDYARVTGGGGPDQAPDEPVGVKALRLGRWLNELDWHCQVAYLAGDEAALQRVSDLIDRVIKLTSTMVQPRDAGWLAGWATAARAGFEWQYRSEFRPSQLARAAEEAEAEVAQGLDDPRQVRDALRRLLATPAAAVAQELADRLTEALPGHLDDVLRMGVQLDRAVRPSPATDFMYEQPVTPGGTIAGDVFTRHGPHGRRRPSVVSGLDAQTVEAALINLLPSPGSAPADPYWLDVFASHCRVVFGDAGPEVCAAAAAAATLGPAELVREVESRVASCGCIQAPTGGSEAEDRPDSRLMRRTGDIWLFRFGTQAKHIRDAKALRLLAELLANPDLPHAYSDLARTDVEGGPARGATPGEVVAECGRGAAKPDVVVDDEGRADIRRQFQWLVVERDRAIRDGDSAAAERFTTELQTLSEQVAPMFDRRGRARRLGRDAEAKAKEAVQAALRRFLDKLVNEYEMGSFAEHLGKQLKHGSREVTYAADHDGPAWVVEKM